jgi:hypothetical protein
MTKTTTCALLSLAMAGCATRQPVAIATVGELPMAGRQPAYEAPDTDPYRKPRLSVKVPSAWTETGPQDAAPGADVVLVHDSGKAIIALQLRATGETALADHAERMIAANGEDFTVSPVMTTADGDRAWFSWTRHSSKHRPVPAQGKVILVRFPTMPERMAVISGTWPAAMNASMVADLNEVAASALLL